MFPSAFSSQSHSAFQGLHAFRGFGDLGDNSYRQQSEASNVPAAASVRIHSESFQLFERVVSVQQSKAGFGPTEAQAPVAVDNQRHTAEKAAGNILNFIEQRLRSDASQGADVEALSERLAEGLEGFKQGFEQASKELDDLGLLTPEVEADIQETYDRVLAGVDALEERLADIAAGKAVATEESVAEVSRPDAGVRAQYESLDYRERNSFKFELTTADGDTVKIRINQQESYSGAYGQASGGGMQVSASGFEHSFDSRFKLEVDGHLDDDEMAAISDLMGQVGELSEQFFAGDLGAAFQQAQSLGYDASEISSFSLNLRQTSVQRMQSAYSDFADVSPGKSMSQLLEPMGRFVEDLTDAARAASERFASVSDLIKDLSQLFEQPEQPSFKDMMGQLLDVV
ncbi:hypothetical protein R50073_22660 [Maricurvus nonylphenolicus]|uniref:DUF5610 domain-containing protein n=1 Tax=Maricurvus nonylphenolicus TaxID=1008307 RepID=UPI0036F1AEC8